MVPLDLLVLFRDYPYPENSDYFLGECSIARGQLLHVILTLTYKEAFVQAHSSAIFSVETSHCILQKPDNVSVPGCNCLAPLSLHRMTFLVIPLSLSVTLPRHVRIRASLEDLGLPIW